MDARADLVEAVLAQPALAAAVAAINPEALTVIVDPVAVANGHAPEVQTDSPLQRSAPAPVAAPAKPAPKAAAPSKSTAASPKSATIEIPSEPEMRALLSKTSTYLT